MKPFSFDISTKHCLLLWGINLLIGGIILGPMYLWSHSLDNLWITYYQPQTTNLFPQQHLNSILHTSFPTKIKQYLSISMEIEPFENKNDFETLEFEDEKKYIPVQDPCVLLPHDAIRWTIKGKELLDKESEIKQNNSSNSNHHSQQKCAKLSFWLENSESIYDKYTWKTSFNSLKPFNQQNQSNNQLFYTYRMIPLPLMNSPLQIETTLVNLFPSLMQASRIYYLFVEMAIGVCDANLFLNPMAVNESKISEMFVPYIHPKFNHQPMIVQSKQLLYYLYSKNDTRTMVTTTSTSPRTRTTATTSTTTTSTTTQHLHQTQTIPPKMPISSIPPVEFTQTVQPSESIEFVEPVEPQPVKPVEQDIIEAVISEIPLDSFKSTNSHQNIETMNQKQPENESQPKIQEIQEIQEISSIHNNSNINLNNNALLSEHSNAIHCMKLLSFHTNDNTKEISETNPSSAFSFTTAPKYSRTQPLVLNITFPILLTQLSQLQFRLTINTQEIYDITHLFYQIPINQTYHTFLHTQYQQYQHTLAASSSKEISLEEYIYSQYMLIGQCQSTNTLLQPISMLWYDMNTYTIQLLDLKAGFYTFLIEGFVVSSMNQKQLFAMDSFSLEMIA